MTTMEDRDSSPPQYRTSLKWLVELGAQSANWDAVRERIRTNPEEVKEIDKLTGRTILHQLCSTAISPTDLVEQVASLYPEATRAQEKTYMATPLHILCYTSQKSKGKPYAVLKYMSSEDVLLRNAFGGTALHSACGSNAMIDVARMIIEKNRNVLVQRTHEYSHTALTALWQSYLQSIPGLVAVANILGGREVSSNLFDKFWEKVELLGCESFTLSPAYPKDVAVVSETEAGTDDSGDNKPTKYLLHGLIFLRAPFKLVKVALRQDPSLVKYADADGNCPLHRMILATPFPGKNAEMIKEVIECDSKVAGVKNKDGDYPVFLALREKMAWKDGLCHIANAHADALGEQDRETGLFPFLLAAQYGGKAALDTTYELLCAKPYLVKGAHDA